MGVAKDCVCMGGSGNIEVKIEASFAGLAWHSRLRPTRRSHHTSKVQHLSYIAIPPLNYYKTRLVLQGPPRSSFSISS